MDKQEELFRLCQKFIEAQRIYRPETVYQSNRVIGNAYKFIEDICDIVGYKEYEEDE
jgi:hypothetical protein